MTYRNWIAEKLLRPQTIFVFSKSDRDWLRRRNGIFKFLLRYTYLGWDTKTGETNNMKKNQTKPEWNRRDVFFFNHSIQFNSSPSINIFLLQDHSILFYSSSHYFYCWRQWLTFMFIFFFTISILFQQYSSDFSSYYLCSTYVCVTPL